MAVTVAAATSPGSASGSSTRRTSWPVVAPIACTASITPRSTSRNAVSTSRAWNGTAPTTSGRIAPRTPSEVPITASVSGIIAIIRMMKGTDRSTFTASASTPLSAR